MVQQGAGCRGKYSIGLIVDRIMCTNFDFRNQFPATVQDTSINDAFYRICVLLEIVGALLKALKVFTLEFNEIRA